MSLLQRPPIDVNAAIGCDRVPAVAEYAATKLLDAADTMRPMCGAIIRHAITNPLLRELPQMSPEEHAEALNEIGILPVLDRVSSEHWANNGSNRKITPGKLQFAHMLGRTGFKHTIDQALDPETRLPLAAPLVLLLPIQGEFEVGTGMLRKYPQNPKAADFFDPPYKGSLERMHFSRLKPGDGMALTTIPPTVRVLGTAEREFLIAGFVAPFEPVNPVK